MSLDGKSILVTGGTGSIGREIIRTAIARGATVSAIDKDGESLVALEQECAGICTVAADLTDPDEAERAVERVYEHAGKVYALVNCVGLIHSSPLVSMARPERKHSVEDWRRVIDANLNSIFYAVREVADRMVTSRTRGVILNFSSISAGGNAGQSAYSAAKAGVEALTVVWAKELGPMGIRVLAIAPGFIDTESTRRALSSDQIEQLRQRVPLRRLGTVQDVAVLTMAALENEYLSGTTLSLDGGLSI